MRCKSCEYPLWQIRDRRCPECGTPFKPSDFDFVLNSVRFCCPHCDQAYYGTGLRGHLVPSEFDCVACHRRISMDEMVLLPTEGVREEQTKVDVNPWLDRKQKGFMAGWFATVIQSMGTPGRLIRATPEHSSVPQAIWFAVLTNSLYLLGGMSLLIVLFLVIGIVTSTTGGAGIGGGGITGVMGPIAVFAGWAMGMVVALMIGAFIWGGIAHGLLRLTGPTAAGIGRTMQCMLYSSGTNIANAIPCLGFYLGWISSIWWAVSATLMLKDGQKVSGGRAALAAILPIGLGLVLAVGLFIFAIVLPATSAAQAAAQAAAAQAAAQSARSSSTDHDRILQLAGAIRSHFTEYGEPPHHAIEMHETQRIAVSVFLFPGPDEQSRMEQSTIVGMTLSDLNLADGETTEAVIKAATASLPGNVIAHRVGDTVFCYHGMKDLAAADPQLWTVIASPEPGDRAAVEYTIGLLDGSVQTLDAATFATSLSHQNMLRADAGLPPLPDPSAVTTDRPAVNQ